MATSLQERLKLKQYQVDTWTTREQLCLASAVMRSGDQNWVAVRRNIRMLTTETSRPPDWYSTKNCALQYAKLLECVDTPKRKRERGDVANESPEEIVTKMLSKQRVEELRTLETKERAEYNRLRREIQELESGRLDHQLDAFWEKLLKERAEEEEKERQYQQKMKEREEKITAIQQALKHQGPKLTIPPHKKNRPGASGGGSAGRRNSCLSETSSEVDSAVDSPDVNEGTNESSAQEEGTTPEPETKPTPTSPLLTSLLSKSSITSLPGSSTSTLAAQLGLGNRPGRSGGISPVSAALKNLVSTAISGTDSVNRDSSAKSNTTSPRSGSSTLSRLLDLPPSAPGGPLPRLSDLPGPDFDEEQGKNEAAKMDTQGKEKEKELQMKDFRRWDLPDRKNSNEMDKATKTEDIVAMEVDTGGGKEIKEEVPTESKKDENKDEDLDNFMKFQVDKLELRDEETVEDKGGKSNNEDCEGTMKEVKQKEKEFQNKEEIGVEILSENVMHTGEGDKKQEDGSKRTTFQNPDESIKEETDHKEKQTLVTKQDNASSSLSNDKSAIKDDKSDCDVKKEPSQCSLPEAKDKKEEEELRYKRKSESEDKEGVNEKDSSEDSSLSSKQCDDESQGADFDFQKKVMKFQKKEEEESPQMKDWLNDEEMRGGKRAADIVSDFLSTSSPFVSESSPISPASTHYGDDPDNERAYKSWKKPIMILWNEIAAHRYASLFLRPITEEKAPGYHSVVYRAMDLQKIKRNIESGLIRNTAEFQRDVMLMFVNAMMYNTRDHEVYQLAYQMMLDSVATMEEFLNTQMLARAEETPQKSLRRETRESSAKRGEDDHKRKRDIMDEKSMKKRRLEIMKEKK